MKVQLENIRPEEQASVRLLHDPKLSDLFFWHFHPEYELVYIEGATGTRHVGEHISTYVDSDLVLIGSYVPHLNCDYGVKTTYLKEVLHFSPDFCNQVLQHLPELPRIPDLLENSQKGLAFYGATKLQVGQCMKKLKAVNLKFYMNTPSYQIGSKANNCVCKKYMNILAQTTNVKLK